MTIREKLEEMNKKDMSEYTTQEHLLWCNAQEAYVTDDEFFIELFNERLNDEWIDEEEQESEEKEMYPTHSTANYRGLPENCTNDEANIVAPNGVKMTHDAFWTLFELNKEIMEVILA